jgi:hypothetical protein
MFFDSPENRKSNTIIESVSAVGDTIPPYIIINGRRRMDNWFNDQLDPETVIDMSDTGYMNNQIGLNFLKHFIEHIESSSSSRYMMLLFNGADSHETEEFKQLAFAHNIILLRYPPHLTHLMQPLDVGCFQSYKFWHERAVHNAIRHLELGYNTSSFLRDLPEFREKTFTPKIIISAFKKSGMWPPDSKVVLKRMKKYSDPVEPLPPLITNKNVLALTPKSISHTLQAGEAWNQRMGMVLSSPSRQNFESYTRGVETQLRVAELEQNDLIQIRMAVKESQAMKATCRMYTVGKGPIKVKDAKAGIAEKVVRRKPKKQVDTELTIEVDDEDGADDELIDPELRGIVFGDEIRDPFEAQYNVIKF